MAAIYKPTEAITHLRPSLLLPRIQHSCRRAAPVGRIAAFSTTRASQAAPSSTPGSNNATPSRKNITLTGDTGQVRWSDLSPGEKAVRTTQQSFNFVVVLIGVLATGTVSYFLFSDVFSPSSKTAHFNRATDTVRRSKRIQALLGDPSQISAYGEASWSRWARNRFIQHTTETDQWGTEHLKFRFFVEGPKGQGVVHVHLTKRPSQSEFEYHTLAVDVKGHPRVYLENAEGKEGRVGPKIFGARWW